MIDGNDAKGLCVCVILGVHDSDQTGLARLIQHLQVEDKAGVSMLGFLAITQAWFPCSSFLFPPPLVSLLLLGVYEFPCYSLLFLLGVSFLFPPISLGGSPAMTRRESEGTP